MWRSAALYFSLNRSGISDFCELNTRELYKLVAEDLLPRFGGANQLLDFVAGAMRMKRRNSASVSADLPVDLKPLLSHDDLLGRIYQAINAPALEAAYRATARTGRKFTRAEIPAVTQLFTPGWVVEFLLQNTLGILWLEMHPDTRLRKNWKWICGGPVNSSPPRPAADLRICDPACGTMNFGLVALDMLRLMYLEEISRAGRAGWPDAPFCADPHEIDATILRRNLIGFDIDPAAIDLALRGLEIKIGKPIGEHQLSVRDALFDARRDDSFDVVVTNPPYLCARNLDPRVVRRLKKRYPCAWRDLYACFMLRCLELSRPAGRVGILSMHSFMFTAAFQRLREDLQRSADVQTVAHFGPGLFDIGNPGTLQTAAVVLQKKPAKNNPAVFFRLVDADDKRDALLQAIRPRSQLQLSQNDLASLPRSAWMYWISSSARRAFREFPRLGEISPPRQGLATTDNMRFVRYWWEVEPPNFSAPRDKWMSYAKGGRFRRWYESPRHRVNWQDEGREIKAAIVRRYPYLDGQWQWVAKNSAWYGREGITYSYLTSGRFSARRLEPGTIFDVAGSSLFPDESLLSHMLGVLNSSAAGELLAAINPTVNFQVGDLRQLPTPRSFPDELRRQVERAIAFTRDLDRFDETSVDFVHPEPWNPQHNHCDELRRKLSHAERHADQIVADLYGIKTRTPPGSHEDPPEEESAQRWISYAVGCWLGRWGGSARGEIAVLSPLDPNLRCDVRRIIAESAGESLAGQIESAVGGLEPFLARDFLPWHNQLYRNRPVFWGFGGGGKTVAVSSLICDARTMRSAFRLIGQTLPDRWRRRPDDGIAINLAPLAAWIADPKLQGYLADVAADLRQGRYDFSETARRLKRRFNPGSCAECAPARPIRRASTPVLYVR
jgi:Eco57I restriction-modification methylase